MRFDEYCGPAGASSVAYRHPDGSVVAANQGPPARHTSARLRRQSTSAQGADIR